jgi:Protein of unknown function (DUF3307)
MFLFLKLYLAHLVTDFILQFEELYHLKVKSLWGHVIHVLILAAVSLLLTIPYLSDPFMWVLIAALTVIHFIQDQIKYKLHRNTPLMFICFSVDQLVHFLVTASVLLFPISKLTLDLATGTLFDFYYAGNKWTLLGIVFILSTFGGSYLLHAFRRSYFSDTRQDHYITGFEMTHALLERCAITAAFLFATQEQYLLFMPLIGLFRMLSPKLRNRLDFCLSFTWAALLGLLFRLFI